MLLSHEVSKVLKMLNATKRLGLSKDVIYDKLEKKGYRINLKRIGLILDDLCAKKHIIRYERSGVPYWSSVKCSKGYRRDSKTGRCVK